MSGLKILKEFAVGMVFLFGVLFMLALGVLLYPLLLVTGFLLRVVFLLLFVAAGVWLLGKLVLYVWRKLK